GTVERMNPGKQSSGNSSVEELIKENQSLREQLKKAQAEIERLRKALEEALRSLKRQAAPIMGSGHFVRFPIVWMNRLRLGCRRSVPTVAGGLFTTARIRSFKKTSCARQLCGGSMWRSATAWAAVDMSRGATPGKLPTLWERHRYKWDRRR